MGRELRRVPPDWEHPKDERTGHYRPLYDQDYETAAMQWIEGFRLWERGEHPRQEGNNRYERYFWDYDHTPERSTCRERKWTVEEATHFQVYEDVSEGTPVSPVLPSREAVVEWLIKEGYSQSAACGFVESGWAPSMMTVNTPGRPIEIYKDIEACAFPCDSD